MAESTETKYLCVDLEMSGGIPGVHDIIQIGAVLLNEDFEELSSFDTLIFPENEEDFDPGSSRVHGISRFELNDAPSLDETLEDLEDWLADEAGYSSRKAMRGLKICGQGINNDISFLKASYHTINLSWPFAYQFLDLQDMTFMYAHMLKKNDKPAPDKLNLNSIGDFFGVERERNKHDALEDARLTAKCFAELMSRVGEIEL